MKVSESSGYPKFITIFETEFKLEKIIDIQKPTGKVFLTFDTHLIQGLQIKKRYAVHP